MADDFTLLDVKTLERFRGTKHTKLDTFVGKLFHHATNKTLTLLVIYTGIKSTDDGEYVIKLYNDKKCLLGEGVLKANDTIVFNKLYIPKAISDKKNRLLGDIEQFILDILI